jgi:hypothetical protein
LLRRGKGGGGGSSYVDLPLFPRIWKPQGLRKWEILTFPEDAPYQVQAVLHWDSLEDFEKATGVEATAKIFADIPNYTTAQAVILKGKLVATKD